MRARLVTTAVLTALLVCDASARTLDSPPFEITYMERDEAVARRSAEVLQEALATFRGYLPAGEEVINVHIVDSIDSFEAAFGVEGARSVEAFASGTSHIVMKPPRLLRPDANYEAVLRHELAHVLIARNADPGNVPRWFNEGIAMMISGEIRWSGPSTVAWMYLSGGLIPYTKLQSAFADPRDEQTFGEAYAQALSMTQYLHDSLGEEAFWSFVLRLREQSFNETLDERMAMSPLDFYEAWHGSLRTVSWGSWAVSGFFALQIAAVLLVMAYLRKKRRGDRVMQAWAVEEAVNAVFEESEVALDDFEDEDEYSDGYEDEWEEDDEEEWWY